MKKLILLTFVALFCGSMVFAQRPYNPSEMTTPYYSQPKFFSVSGGMYFFQKERTTSIPLYINPSIVIIKNLEVGLHMIHYTYKHYVEYESNTVSSDLTLYPEDADKFSHIFIGIKTSYHLSDILLQYAKVNLSKKWDLYASGMAGYNMIGHSSDGAVNPLNKDAEETRARFGLGVGIRYIRTKRVAFNTEFGWNDYGYGSLGLTYFISKGN